MNYPRRNGKASPAGDQRFKEIVHDREILAAIIGGVIPEFRGMSREEIFGYLELNKDGYTVRGRKTEFISSSEGPVYMDSVFDVRSPVEGMLSIIVAIEGQGPQMAAADLHNRQIYYSSRLINEQGKEYPDKRELYRNMRKTTAIWVKLSPRAEERNTIVYDSRYRYPIDEPGKLLPSPLDKTDIIEINVGPYDSMNPSELLCILGVLFSKSMGEKEKDEKLREKYNISLRSSIIREAGDMGALAEEYEMYGEERFEQGIEKGIEQGIEKGIEQGRMPFIDNYVEIVLRRYEQGIGTLEQLVDDPMILPESRGQVLEKVRSILADRQ